MYVSVNGALYAAPWGSEFLGLRDDGVPMAYYRAGWVGPMVPSTADISTLEDNE